MKRKLFTLAAAVSLLVCLGAIVLLVRGAQTSDRWDFSFSSRTPSGEMGTLWTVQGGGGGLGVARAVVLRQPVSRRHGRDSHPLLILPISNSCSLCCTR